MFMEHFLGIYEIFMGFLWGISGVFLGFVLGLLESYEGLIGGSLMTFGAGSHFWFVGCSLGSKIEIHWELMGVSAPSSPQENSLRYQVRNSQPSVHVRSIV